MPVKKMKPMAKTQAARKESVVSWRNRVKELRTVPASTLKPHPKNPRRHDKAQRQAMTDVIRELGFADAILAYESKGELITLDGHMRAEEAGDSNVPVLVLDLTDAEAEYFLATHDPLTAMGKVDLDSFQALDIQTGSLQVQDMIDQLTKSLTEQQVQDPGADAEAIDEMELQPFEKYDYIMLLFNNDQEFSNACERLSIKPVAVNYGPKCRKVGLGRVVKGSEVMGKLCGS